MDDDGGQRGLEELGWMVDGVGVQHHQLQGAGQLEDPFNLTLDLGCRDETSRTVKARRVSQILSLVW